MGSRISIVFVRNQKYKNIKVKNRKSRLTGGFPADSVARFVCYSKKSSSGQDFSGFNASNEINILLFLQSKRYSESLPSAGLGGMCIILRRSAG